MKITAEALLEDLSSRSRENLTLAEAWLEQPTTALNAKPSSGSWSALECIEHLNRYGDFYLPEISNRMQHSTGPAAPVVKSGWLGNKFANMLLPGAKKMQTFSAMNPNGSQLDKEVIRHFIEQQKQLLDLLKSAAAVNLNKTKTSISISKFIKLRLGDTFRVVIYHNQRHMQQAARALHLQKETNSSAINASA